MAEERGEGRDRWTFDLVWGVRKREVGEGGKNEDEDGGEKRETEASRGAEKKI